MKLNKYKEKTTKAWLIRALVGPAHIIDGVFLTISVGFVSTGLVLSTTKYLAKTRIGK